MAFRVAELRRGLHRWDEETNWPRDLHNSFYWELRAIRRQEGLFAIRHKDWWKHLVLPRLSNWQATRPVRPQIIAERARRRFHALNILWNNEIMPEINNDIETVEWQCLQGFVELVEQIKSLNNPSPVFASKLCHFLVPNIFPVIDTELRIKLERQENRSFGSYEDYYEFARAEWRNTTPEEMSRLKEIFAEKSARRIEEKGYERAPGYPTKCKIIELCFWGRNG